MSRTTAVIFTTQVSFFRRNLWQIPVTEITVKHLNRRYNPQMWGTQSGYFNKRSADAEPKADADAFFGRSFCQPQQQWGPSSYSNNWSRPQGYNFFGYY